jgi:hypothetical protein
MHVPPAPTTPLELFRANEGANRHSENALMLAQWFGSADEIEAVEAAISYRDIHGGYPSDPNGLPNAHWMAVFEITMKYSELLLQTEQEDVSLEADHHVE